LWGKRDKGVCFMNQKKSVQFYKKAEGEFYLGIGTLYGEDLFFLVELCSF